MLTEKQKKELDTLAAMPDESIDLSDIPEASAEQWKTAVRGPLHKRTVHVSIRLNSTDVDLANRLAAKKGLPYQTYIKGLLHESLMKEAEGL
jgi:predicted DNA binding CopG/RHH family protein